MERFKICNIENKQDFLSNITEYLSTLFEYEVKESYSYSNLKELVQQLKNNITFFIEYPHIDNLYLDKYSTYYSTRFQEISRYVVRVHLFDSVIKEDDFWDPNKQKRLDNNYLGNFILQPTKGSLVGQSFISPKAFEKLTYANICQLVQSFVVSGVKLSVKGFYHSFLDNEVASCAYNSVWSFMNYYSNKSNEHIHLFPSQVNQILENTTGFNLKASYGLNIEQLSYILKKNQFSTYIYNRNIYGELRFKQILYSFIDSGFPVFAFYSSEDLSHVNLLIGKEKSNKNNLRKNKKYINYEFSEKIRFSDFSFYVSDYIAIDDNFLPYKQIDISEKGNIFGNKLRLTSILVPLPNKIMTESYKAFNISLKALEIIGKEVAKTELGKIYTKLSLLRSDEFELLVNSKKTIKNDLKTLLIDYHLPDYIWIMEISNEKLFTTKHSLGFIIIDATIGEHYYNYNLVYFNGKLIFLHKGKYNIIKCDNQPFPFITEVYTE